MTLRRLREATFQSFSKVKEAGPITYPANHKPALRVPKGGSCCANCKFWDGNDCESKEYQKWAGTDKIPVPPDEFCSDWWEPR